MHALSVFAGIDLDGVKRSNIVTSVQKVVVQGQHTRKNYKLVEYPRPMTTKSMHQSHSAAKPTTEADSMMVQYLLVQK